MSARVGLPPLPPPLPGASINAYYLDIVGARVVVGAVYDELLHQLHVRLRHFLRIRQNLGHQHRNSNLLYKRNLYVKKGLKKFPKVILDSNCFKPKKIRKLVNPLEFLYLFF